jgi:hypothetical protein
MGHPDQTLTRQQLLHATRKLRLRSCDHARGNLFKSNFKEKIWHLFSF